MTNTETSTLVFKDQTGAYFVLPQEALERGRVPAERTAEIERLVAAQPDVQGHNIVRFLGLVLVGELIAVGIGFDDFGHGRAASASRGQLQPVRDWTRAGSAASTGRSTSGGSTSTRSAGRPPRPPSSGCRKS